MKISRYIWLVWGVFLFMFEVSIATPIYLLLILIFGKRIRFSLLGVNYRVIAPSLLWLCGVRTKVHGLTPAMGEGANVYISNHNSLLDVLVNAKVNPQPAFFLAKKSLVKFPIFGLMVKALGILVDRKDEASRKKSYEYMKQTLLEGHSLFIYPEGTRNRTSEPMKDFYDGAFRSAIEAQVPIVSQTLVGVKDIYNPDKKFELRMGTIQVYFDGPFETKGLSLQDLPALKEKIYKTMEKHLIA